MLVFRPAKFFFVGLIALSIAGTWWLSSADLSIPKIATNCAISGETIDYGPCAMMNHYDHQAVFSSIDQYARYAFGNQSQIMQWNMARLADCILPLVDSDELFMVT